jgi:glycosyltransferase involved in cell wall biosynthesis
MALSFHELPQCLFLFLTGKYDEDEQLAVGDVAELHARGLRWRAICIGDSEVHRKLHAYGLGNLVTLASPPAHNLDRTLKELLADEISKGAGIIHCYDTDYLGSILPWMLRFPNIPVVVSEGPKVQKRLRHFFQSLFYQRIDAILVPTSTLRKRIAQMRPALSHRIRVVHPGLDFNVFNPDQFDFKILRKKWGIDPEHHLVGMIASQEYPKAQATFIKAAASFLRNEELAKRTRFVIVGFSQVAKEEARADSAYHRELIQLIEQFHLQEQIILAPPEESIPKVLGSLDVYVLPSSKAMFGLQAIESLAMGTPIICASGPDANEWTGNSQCGHTMRSGDSFDLQRKLRMILEDPSELKVMGQRAVQFARENYDRHLRTERLHEIYDRAVKRRAAVGGDSAVAG